MNLHILFGQRKQRYEGEHAPEPLLCWSEYEVDENPEGFDLDVAETLKKRGADFEVTRLILIRVDDQEIERVLNQAPVLEGQVV